jgi:hypothetical protein
VAGSLAAGGWFVIHYIRIMLMTGDGFGVVLQKLWPLSPFAILPFAAAFALSWMIDLRPERWSLPRRAWRWLEGLGLGGVLAGAACIAYTYVQVLSPAGPRPGVHVIVLVQVGLGFLIGALVPHLYRRATNAAAAEGRTDDEAPDALSPRAALAHGAD